MNASSPAVVPDAGILWHTFHDELRSFVRRRVSADEACDDILQTAFLRAHEAIEDGRGPEEPRAWLYQIVRRILFDTYRRAAHDVTAETVDEEQIEVPSPDEEEAFCIVSRALPRFIATLDAPYREALLLTEIEGLSQKDAADAAGVTLSCMKSRVLRGRSQLFAALQRCCRFEIDGRGKPIECYERQSGTNCNTCS